MIYWATFGVLFSLIYLFIITAIRWFRFILSKWSKLFQIIYLELLYYILCKINTILLQKWFMYYLQSLNWIESNDMVIWWPSENPYRLITNLKHVLITYYYYKHRNVLVFFLSIFTFECICFVFFALVSESRVAAWPPQVCVKPEDQVHVWWWS